MMTQNTPVRVSILERIVPSVAFVVAALGGAVGSAMIFRFFSMLWRSESAGYAAFFGGVVAIELAVAGVLIAAAVLCGIGILISLIRLFTTNTKASPPGYLFLIGGLLSLVPPFAIHYVLHLMKEVVRTPGMVEGGISGVAGSITTIAWSAVAAAGVVALAMLAFSFIPFSARAGRKASPLICLFLMEILIAGLAGIFFWEAKGSLNERDKVAQASTEAIEPDNYNGDPGIIARPDNNSYQGAADTNSWSLKGRTISGGVLNGKATDLPQPEYPAAARAVRAAGSVMVQVTVDETGKVVSASAVTGHPLLRAAAVQAARNAKFEPTKVSGKSVNVSGVLTYNFSLE
jgi:TonB family protein